MTFLEHLEELRRVIIDSVIGLLVAAAAGWFLSEQVLNFLVDHVMPPDMPVIFIGPAEGFTNRLKVALALGVAIALPFMAWRIWRFVVPGLLTRERKAIVPLSVASTLLFYLGVGFAFATLVPIVIRILLSFGGERLTPTIAIGPLLAFVLRLCLACGLVFQMPLVIAVLTHLGLVTPAWLLGRWRYAVLIIFLLAAVMTPADGASQLILGIPVTALYFFSVGVSHVIARRKIEEEIEEEVDEEDGPDEPDEPGPDDPRPVRPVRPGSPGSPGPAEPPAQSPPPGPPEPPGGGRPGIDLGETGSGEGAPGNAAPGGDEGGVAPDEGGEAPDDGDRTPGGRTTRGEGDE